MKLKMKFWVKIVAIFLVVLFGNVCYAGEQELNSLNYEVQLNEDGSMQIVETWDIYISQTNTLFKNFNIEDEKYSGIRDVKVKDLETGLEFTQIDEAMYHVTKNCFYALPISGGKYEIAWGVSLDNSSDTRKYQISYTIDDAVTVYNDCSELYWMFVSEESGIPADIVTGTIKLPRKVKSFDALRVWAHGPLNGEINKDSNDTVTFEVSNFSANTMLETRIVVEEPIFTQSTKKVAKNKLSSILAEEQKWADDANAKRNAYKTVFIVIGIIDMLLMVFFASKIKKYLKELKDTPKENYYIEKMQYFRDIPQEKDATPALASFLYYSKKNKFENTYTSKVFSATLLQLCLKKYLTFEKQDKDIVINLLKDITNEEEQLEIDLKPSEIRIYKFLHKIAKKTDLKLTISEINDYAKVHYDSVHSVMEDIIEDAKKENINLKNFDRAKEKKVKEYDAKGVAYIVGSIVVVTTGIGIIFIPVIIEWIISAIILSKTSKKINILTEQGENERVQWKALKKYMEDFSMLDERDIPDLILWEKYLVYATAFGISEKVVKQLKVVYPEIENINDDRYMYMHYMSSSRYGTNFINDFNKGMDRAYRSYVSAYNAAHSSSSSGSGSGGGFSSGGGGRRRRWPEWAEDKKA